ncbi:hypothetical protein KUV85_11485 [Nocardioides panacisoli]|uniref:hypothetical protein n=1 Tax=Nocardioides panacisoli TaxID=627624 RepID=UPI001C6261F1|nr:hypothetical protein [Nocardioides panacisoli]QYJ02956.1 hypothetical protein KUV85_11485 [Nocardioides panacisoli]
MATKRKAFIHVGMPGVGDVLGPALAHHRDALVELGINAPAKHAQESFRAAVEVTRSHRTWGIRRKHVEGTWADVYRRAGKGRDTVAFSAPLLATAEPDQIDLFVDGLSRFEVHVVVTASAPHAFTVLGEPDADLGVVLERWGRAVRSPERIHVVLADGDPTRHGDEQARIWRTFGDIVGFGTASLGLEEVPQPVAARAAWLVPTAPMARAGVLDAIARSWVDHLHAQPYDVHGDPTADLTPRTEEASAREEHLDQVLEEAIREIERLTRRNEALAAELATAPPRRFGALRPTA